MQTWLDMPFKSIHVLYTNNFSLGCCTWYIIENIYYNITEKSQSWVKSKLFLKPYNVYDLKMYVFGAIQWYDQKDIEALGNVDMKLIGLKSTHRLCQFPEDYII